MDDYLRKAHPKHGHHYEAHVHDHGMHEHGDHDHGKGLLGWLHGTFAHSHSTSDKVDAALETHERGIWALKSLFVGLAVTAIMQAIIVAISGSVALLADTIHNFADAGTSIPLWIAFAFARRGASRRFTYGFGKIEDVAGVIIVLIIFSSACVAATRFAGPRR
jgi:Co/Zn/Cd efflux system component